jgi:hypothetical protein
MSTLVPLVSLVGFCFRRSLACGLLYDSFGVVFVLSPHRLSFLCPRKSIYTYTIGMEVSDGVIIIASVDSDDGVDDIFSFSD